MSHVLASSNQLTVMTLFSGFRLQAACFTNPTRLLWLGNVTACLTLIIILTCQGYIVWVGSRADMPEIEPLRPQPVHMPAVPTGTDSRNAFDISAAHWRADIALRTQEVLLGVIMLPGVRSAITSNGTVKTGEIFSGGRLLEVFDNRVVVERPTGPETIMLPLARHPTLQSLTAAGSKQNSKNEGTK